MNRLTKYATAATFALGGTFTAVAASSAMPMMQVAPTAGLVEHVAYGCGPGWHPNPWGRCVPYRRVVYPPYYYGPYYGPSFYVWHPYHRWHHWRRW